MIAAVASVVLGLFSFTLPDTPPKAKGTQTTFAKVLELMHWFCLKTDHLLVFLISSILICIPLSFYYSFTNLLSY